LEATRSAESSEGGYQAHIYNSSGCVWFWHGVLWAPHWPYSFSMWRHPRNKLRCGIVRPKTKAAWLLEHSDDGTIAQVLAPRSLPTAYMGRDQGNFIYRTLELTGNLRMPNAENSPPVYNISQGHPWILLKKPCVRKTSTFAPNLALQRGMCEFSYVHLVIDSL